MANDAPCAAFNTLLAKLAEEHMKQVGQLRGLIATMRKLLQDNGLPAPDDTNGAASRLSTASSVRKDSMLSLATGRLPVLTESSPPTLMSDDSLSSRFNLKAAVEGDDDDLMPPFPSPLASLRDSILDGGRLSTASAMTRGSRDSTLSTASNVRRHLSPQEERRSQLEPIQSGRCDNFYNARKSSSGSDDDELPPLRSSSLALRATSMSTRNTITDKLGAVPARPSGLRPQRDTVTSTVSLSVPQSSPSLGRSALTRDTVRKATLPSSAQPQSLEVRSEYLRDLNPDDSQELCGSASFRASEGQHVYYHQAGSVDWNQEHEEDDRGRLSGPRLRSGTLATLAPSRGLAAVWDLHLQRFVIAPHDTRRMCWDFLGMLMVAYEVCVVPIAIVFDLNEQAPFYATMRLLAVIFWSLDVVFSFFVGYNSKGRLYMAPHVIALHYLKTWFFLDLFVIALDYMYLLSALSMRTHSNAGLRAVLRMLRTLRMIRLLRCMKLKRMIASFQDRVNSEHLSIVLGMATNMMVMLVATHFAACLFFAVGIFSKDRGMRNWIVEQGFIHESVEYQYATALHWSLTQFTPASMHVQAWNTYERAFSIFVLLVALVIFSSFLGTITTSMTQIRAMRGEESQQFWFLRRYLREAHVHQSLSYRIQRYLEFAVAVRQTTIPETKVRLLDMLTDQLRSELRSAVNAPVLTRHPFFKHLAEVGSVVLPEVSSQALSRMFLARGDNVFFDGQQATHMSFVVRGELMYLRGVLPKTVRHSIWLSEAALWTTWHHVGQLRAMCEAELLQIEAEKFGKIMRKHRAEWEISSLYAELFREKLAELQAGEECDLLDKQFPNALADALQLDVQRTGTEKARRVSTLPSLSRGLTTTVATARQMLPGFLAPLLSFAGLGGGRGSVPRSASRSSSWEQVARTSKISAVEPDSPKSRETA